jgi:Lipocalin-like domain
MNWARIVGALTMIALALALPSTDAVAQQKTLKEQLVGAWTFVSSTTKLPDGSPSFGSDPKGLLIFTVDGRYSNQIHRSDLPKFASKNRLQGTPDENKAVVQGSVSSFGTYSVDEASVMKPHRFPIWWEHSRYGRLPSWVLKSRSPLPPRQREPE